MRCPELEPAPVPGHAPRRQPGVARRVADLVPSGAAALSAPVVVTLQRSAGNAAVASLLREEKDGTGGERSPVLDVVSGGGGRALDGTTRATMERALGHDFGDVRIHTGAAAEASARTVQARAYTVGNDIVLGAGVAPSSGDGRRTLAHELAHVVQQRSGPVEGTPAPGGIAVSDPSDRFERAAEATAAEVVAGGDSAEGAVQRQAEEPEEEPEEELAR